MKKAFLIAYVLTGSLMTQAADYNYLNIKLITGSEKQFEASGLVLTFADDNLTVTSGGSSTTIAQNTLASMYFTNDVSGIDEAQAVPSATLRLNGRTLTISAEAGSQVTVVSMGGILIDRYIAGTYPETTALRPGIYIVKINGKSTKIHVR